MCNTVGDATDKDDIGATGASPAKKLLLKCDAGPTAAAAIAALTYTQARWRSPDFLASLTAPVYGIAHEDNLNNLVQLRQNSLHIHEEEVHLKVSLLLDLCTSQECTQVGRAAIGKKTTM